MKSFCSFEELGLEDYIIYLNWNYKGKLFSKDMHTYGDVSRMDILEHPNCFPTKRQYKNFVLNKTETSFDNSSEDLGFRNKENIKEIKQDIIKEIKQEFTKEITKEISTEVGETHIKENITSNSATQSEVPESNSSEFKHNNQTTTNVTQELIHNQTQQSSSFTMEQLIQLEENLNQINNVTNIGITKKEFGDYKKSVQSIHNDLDKNIKRGDKETREILDKFLNS